MVTAENLNKITSRIVDLGARYKHVRRYLTQIECITPEHKLFLENLAGELLDQKARYLDKFYIMLGAKVRILGRHNVTEKE